MKPFKTHILILTFLIMLGIVLLIVESLSEYDGGWLFDEYILTKLYFLVLVGYSLFSTLIVSLVWFFYKRKKKVLTRSAVILSHVIPVGMVWLFFSLGLHDLIQDTFKEKDHYKPPKAQAEKTERKMPPPSPKFEREKRKISEGGQAIEPEKQESE